MKNSEKKNIWQDIKNTWNEQPQFEKINIQVSQLITEFKSKVSQFEKDSIKKDIATLKLNWAKTKINNVSQFEKDLIEKSVKYLKYRLSQNTFNNIGLFIGIGTSTGISFGVAFGSVYDNIGIGIVLGTILGGGIGFILWLIIQKINDKKD